MSNGSIEAIENVQIGDEANALRGAGSVVALSRQTREVLIRYHSGHLSDWIPYDEIRSISKTTTSAAT